MRRRHQEHQLVSADRHFEQPLGRPERQRAKIETALLDLDHRLPGRNPANVDGDVGVALAESCDQRQQGVNRGFVRADQDPSTTQVAKIADR